jgi:hypothetical protein
MRDPEDSLGVNAYLDDLRSQQTCNCYIPRYNLAGIGTRQRVRFCVEELLSPDLDLIKQGEQVA